MSVLQMPGKKQRTELLSKKLARVAGLYIGVGKERRLVVDKKAKKRFLDQEAVTSYATLSARIDALKTKKENMRLDFVANFQKGYRCPTAGPFLLEYTTPERTDISWKEEFTTLAKKFLGSGWKKYMRKVKLAAEKNTVPTIHIKPNPRYESER